MISSVFIAGMALSGTVAAAEPLAVVGTQANAFSFGYRGVCWAIFPNHITSRGGFDVVTQTPSRTGRVDIISYMRFPELDLALGQLIGDASMECEPVIGDLHSSDFATSSSIAQLTTVRHSGQLQRTAVRVNVVEYAYIGLDPVNPDEIGTIGRGRSGSVITEGDRPVGIMIDISSEEINYGAEIRALRMDAALNWISRYLDQRNVGPSSSLADEVSGTEIPFEVVAWSALPVEGDPRSIASSSLGPYVIAANDLPATIEIDVDRALMSNGGDRIIFESSADDEAFTVPREVSISAKRTERSPFRFLNTMNVGQNGKGEATIRDQSFEGVEIRIESVWDPSKPIRLDRLRVLVNTE